MIGAIGSKACTLWDWSEKSQQVLETIKRIIFSTFIPVYLQPQRKQLGIMNFLNKNIFDKVLKYHVLGAIRDLLESAIYSTYLTLEYVVFLLCNKEQFLTN